jgi:hypothetical protein
MTGWDTPSRPTWDPQDGPDDGTQAFSSPDTSIGDDDPWAAPAGPAGPGWGASAQSGGADFGGADFGGPGAGDAFSGPPPEFFTPEFEQRTPGASLGRAADMPSWDLPVRDGAGRGRNGARGGNGSGRPGIESGRGSEHSANGAGAQSPAREQAPAWDEPQWQEAPRQDFGGPDFGGPDFGRQDLPRRELGSSDFGRQDLPRRELGSSDFGRQDPPRPDFGGPDFGRQDDYGREDLTRQDLARQDFGRQDLARPDFGAQDFGGQDFGGQDFGPQDPADQDFPRRQPGRAYSDEQDYAAQPAFHPAQDYDPQPAFHPAHPDSPDQGLAAPPRVEQERAARMDPALQDFFAPTSPGSGSGYGSRHGQGAPGRQTPGRPADPWDDPVNYQSPGPRRGSDGPGSHGGSGSRESSRGRAGWIIAVGAVVVVVVGAGGYLFLHKSSGSNAANSTTPTVSASTPTAPTPTASAKAKPKAAANSHVSGSATADSWVLSTPSVAGGYPIGTDPNFLATATTAATTIEHSAVSGGGGTVKGNPVSASYTLPDEQTIEFVGYQGTFNPKTVMTNLGSFGSGEATYNAGPHGGEMACANVPATATAASGGVCVWVSTTTLGVTEFFAGTGPEVLTVAQAKGAQDTVALRSSVETRKS